MNEGQFGPCGDPKEANRSVSKPGHRRNGRHGPGNGGFLPNSTFLGMVPTGRFVPNAVYRGSHDNVGFWATAVTTSTSDMRRKQQIRLRLHLGRT